MAVLSDAELEAALSKLPGWNRREKLIEKHFEFKNFKEAMFFVNAVAYAAERADHHPDIDVRWNKVTMALWSHDSGGVTARDVKMAGKIDEIFGPSLLLEIRTNTKKQ